MKHLRRFLAAPILAVLLVCLVFAPACTTPKRTETLHTALVVTDSAHAAFVAYSADHQAQIARTAPDEATTTKQLTEWRVKEKVVEKYFAAAYDAIGIAVDLNDDHSLAGVMKAVGDVTNALIAAGVMP